MGLKQFYTPGKMNEKFILAIPEPGPFTGRLFMNTRPKPIRCRVATCSGKQAGTKNRKEGFVMKCTKKLAIIPAVALFFTLIGGSAMAGSDVRAVLRAGGGAVGGAGFVMLTGLNKVVKDAYPKISTTVVPGGWVGNVTRVNSGELDLASTANTLCAMAQKGEAPMNKPFPKVRSLFNVQDEMFYFMVARKDLPVNSVSELIEKKYPAKMCTLSKGSITEMEFRLALASKDVTWEDITDWGGKVNFVRWGDAVSLIKDGHADLICAAAIGKAGWLMELTTVREMKVLTWGKDLCDLVNAKSGTVTRTMKAGLYKGIGYDVDCPASSGEIIINANVADDVAYAIVKAMSEGVEAYRGHHAALRTFTAEGMAENLGLPVHPGAEKFYKEKGYIH